MAPPSVAIFRSEFSGATERCNGLCIFVGQNSVAPPGVVKDLFVHLARCARVYGLYMLIALKEFCIFCQNSVAPPSVVRDLFYFGQNPVAPPSVVRDVFLFG